MSDDFSYDDNFTIYVSNIPRDSVKYEIEDFFSEIGPCAAKMIFERDTNKFRGIAFVSFGRIDACKKAVIDCDGKEFRGQQLTVRLSDHTRRYVNDAGAVESVISMVQELKKENTKEARIEEIDKTLSVVAPIEILIGSLISRGHTKQVIRTQLVARMEKNEFEEIEPTLNEIIARIMYRRESGHFE